MQGIQVAAPAVLADLFSSSEEQQCGIASYLKEKQSLKKQPESCTKDNQKRSLSCAQGSLQLYFQSTQTLRKQPEAAESRALGLCFSFQTQRKHFQD